MLILLYILSVGFCKRSLTDVFFTDIGDLLYSNSMAQGKMGFLQCK
jgi:hypothetical protein